MNLYAQDNDTDQMQDVDADGENTMAVLSTLGGGGDALPEGEAIGLDAVAKKTKISGSGLAVGVVVVLGALSLVGMKLTLGVIGVGTDPATAIAEIDGFIATYQSSPQSTVDTGSQDQQSKQVLEELKQDPNAYQIPAEQVQTNPFDLGNVFASQTTTDGTTTKTPTLSSRQVAIEEAQRVASKLKVDMISGKIAYIDGQMYRIGDAIGKTGFKLESIEGLTCKIRTTDEHKLLFRLRYR